MSEQQNLEQESTLDLNSEMATRRAKLAALREEGIAFPNDFRRDSISGDLHAAFDDKSKEEL
ncbi:MAG: lysine--tRNA ligase, partial [Plesiomonas shigelloides]